MQLSDIITILTQLVEGIDPYGCKPLPPESLYQDPRIGHALSSALAIIEHIRKSREPRDSVYREYEQALCGMER